MADMLVTYPSLRLPLVQCKQKFSAMDVQYRENVASWIVRSAPKFG